MADRFDKFTERARRVLTHGQEEAQRFNHNYIGTEHLLLGLIREEDGVAAKVLASLGVKLLAVRSAVEFIIGRGDRAVLGEIGLTPRAKKVIELAVDEARRLNHHYIGTEHLLLGLVREGEGIAAGVLESLGVDLQDVRSQTARILSGLPRRAPQGAASPSTPEIAALQHEMLTVRAHKEAAIATQDYERAATLRDEEVAIQRLLDQLRDEAGRVQSRGEVSIPGRTASVRFRAGHSPLEQSDVYREAFALGLALSMQSRAVLQRAKAEAERLGHPRIGPEHLLLALIVPDEALGDELWRRGVDLDAVRAAVESLLHKERDADAGDDAETPLPDTPPAE